MASVRLDFSKQPWAEEAFFPTYAPFAYAASVAAWYAVQRPELPRLCAQRFTSGVELDAEGPVYGPGEATVRVERGYRVNCPLSHVAFLVDWLRSKEFLVETIDGHRLVFFPNRFFRSVLAEQDLDEIADRLSTFAHQGETQRLAALAGLSQNPNVHVAHPPGALGSLS